MTIARAPNGYRIGECHPRARLPDADVRLMRALHAQGLGYRRLAAKFECGVSTARDIVTYRTRYCA